MAHQQNQKSENKPHLNADSVSGKHNDIEEQDGLAEAKPLHYTSLDQSSMGIRLLELLPAVEDEEDICCSLVYTTLDERPNYEALSYHWGDPSITREITVDDVPVSVTVNLENALRQLRYKEKVRTIWVDAICINQHDLEERKHQVAHMSDIYGQCVRDIVWMGSCEEDITDLITTFANSMPLSAEPNPGWLQSSRFRRQAYDFLNNIVFDRIWIVQEVALAPSLTIQYGKYVIPWRIFEAMLHQHGFIQYADAYHGSWSHDVQGVGILMQAEKLQLWEQQRQTMRQEHLAQKTTFLDVVCRFRHLDSTDPRDKIYALLGLVQDNLGVQPDYSKPIREVFLDMAMAHIRSKSNLDIIAQSQWEAVGNKKRRSDVPTWVPDFSNPGESDLLFAQRGIFQAGADQISYYHLEEQKYLVLKGIYLGTLGTSPPDTPHFIRDRLLHWLPAIYKRPEIKTYVFPDKHFEAFWRTLLADCHRDVKGSTKRLDEELVHKLGRLFEDWLTDETVGFPHISDEEGYAYKLFHGSRFATTTNDLYCKVPNTATEGDHIVVFDGAKVPLVVRPATSTTSRNLDAFWFVGPAYVHNFMDRQAAQWMADSKLSQSEYWLC